MPIELPSSTDDPLDDSGSGGTTPPGSGGTGTPTGGPLPPPEPVLPAPVEPLPIIPPPLTDAWDDIADIFGFGDRLDDFVFNAVDKIEGITEDVARSIQTAKTHETDLVQSVVNATKSAVDALHLLFTGIPDDISEEDAQTLLAGNGIVLIGSSSPIGNFDPQQPGADCSVYRLLDAKYGGESLVEECLAGNLPTQISPTPSLSPSITCPWGGNFVLSSATFGDKPLCHYTYDPGEAIRYAERWKGHQSNPLFWNFSAEAGGDGDCANFVSQALLYGGLPMTDAWHCSGESGEPCASEGHTPSWTGAYLTGENIGEYLPEQTGIDPIPGEFGPGQGSTDPNTESRVGGMGASLAGTIGQGDVLYMEGQRTNDDGTTGRYPHVALIVGWGPYVTTWEDVRSAQVETEYSPETPVPYVLDHGPHSGTYAETRPYYALAWEGNEQFIWPLGYSFLKVPTSITVPLDEAQRREPPFSREQMFDGTW